MIKLFSNVICRKSQTTQQSPACRNLLVCCLLGIIATGIAWSQSPGETETAVTQMLAPVQMVNLDEYVGVFSFQHRSGATVVPLKGTKLAPKAAGKLKVESKAGFLELDVNRGGLEGLPRAVHWGRDFLTYVFWAVSMDGRAQNLGEIQFNQRGEMSGINVTTTHQTFWLMVTAEPHFAVNEPSDVVVMVSKSQRTVDTSNQALSLDADPIYYTHYAATYNKTHDTTGRPSQAPLELIQARKAVVLAETSGILKHPTPPGQTPLEDEVRTRKTLESAREFLRKAEVAAADKKARKKTIIQFARTAAQAAESARALSVGGVGQVYARQLMRELDRRKNAYERLLTEQTALTSANEDMRRELSRLRSAADQLGSDSARLQKQLTASIGLNTRLQNSLEKARDENERLRMEKAIICDELQRQLESLGQINQKGDNIVLTLASDILFDFDKFDLRPAAKEGLGKLSILQLLLFRDVPVKYEGHTDWVGAEDYNQWLSEQRALRVAEYLLEQRLLLYKEDPNRVDVEGRLRMVKQLLAMNFPRSQGRDRNTRNSLMADLGSLVEGFGFRRLTVNVQGKSERNRRVEVVFSQREGGAVTSICDFQIGETEPRVP